MVELALLGIAGLVNVLLGLLVYVKNSKSVTNKLFLLLTGSFVVWSVINYISVHPVFFPQIIWVRLVLFCAAFLCLAMYLTFSIFPSHVLVGKKSTYKTAALLTGLVMIWTLTPYVFVINNEGHPAPSFGIPVFTLLIIGLLGTGLYNLIKKYRHSKGRQKVQIRFMLFGIAVTFGLIFVANFLLVVALNYTALIPFGPAFTLAFSGSLAYAIIKHRLFDIRAAVARALAYLLSLGSIALVYGGIVFALTELLVSDGGTVTFQRIFYIGLAILTSLVYHPIKKFFDKLTNQIFYQDAYDPQAFIAKLNKTLVTSVDLEPLLRQASRIIESDLKAEHCFFALHQTKYTAARNVGIKGVERAGLSIDRLHEAADHLKRRIILTDEIAEGRLSELGRVLQEKNVSVLIRLAATQRDDADDMGYLVLGPKKSGNAYTSQDVKILGIIANELVIAVENALRFEEIAQFNITLQQKVNDATRQLRRTNEKLKALDETKDEFISMASHQLRTPLTAVKGYLSMVLEGDAGKISGQQRKLLDQAFLSSQRMVYLIADLLNVSRLRTGKFIIEAVESNLAEVVAGEIAQLEETAASRGLELTYDKPADFPVLMLDETKIRQVVMNFVDNAIYYTPSGGHVNVIVEDKGQSVEFRVEDDGLGVPKADQHHLFSKFYRAGNAKKARPDGTGLGLFMAKKVVVAQGGSIIFRSKEGKGSTFGFSFAKDKLSKLSN